MKYSIIVFGFVMILHASSLHANEERHRSSVDSFLGKTTVEQKKIFNMMSPDQRIDFMAKLLPNSCFGLPPTRAVYFLSNGTVLVDEMSKEVDKNTLEVIGWKVEESRLHLVRLDSFGIGLLIREPKDVWWDLKAMSTGTAGDEILYFVFRKSEVHQGGEEWWATLHYYNHGLENCRNSITPEMYKYAKKKVKH